MSNATLLSITGAGDLFSDYSVRGLRMSLQPIAAASQLERTINGDLEDLSLNQFHDKYEGAVECEDHESPDFVGVRPGTQVTVTCIPHLGRRQDDSAGPLTLVMRIVAWSVRRDEYGCATSWSLQLSQ